MRFIVVIAMAVFLTSCRSKEGDARAEINRNATSECIQREAASVASKQVDIDTAAYSVIAMCSSFINVERQALISDYPGYRDEVEVSFRKVEAVRFDQARSAVAIARTR